MKVLLAPFLIILDVILAIWYIYPAINDSAGGTGVYQKAIARNKEKDMLDGIAKEKGNVSSLASFISSNSAYSDALAEYVPESESTDEIISGLNSIVVSSGSVVYGISTDKSGNEAAGNADSSAGQSPVSEDGTVSASMPDQAAVSVAPKARTISADLTFAGDYENMKNVLASLYRMKRFAGIRSLSIIPMKDESNNPNGMLETKIGLEFAYYPKAKGMKDADIDNAVFSSDSFDTSSLDDLLKTRTGDIASVSVDQAGRTNPFAMP